MSLKVKPDTGTIEPKHVLVQKYDEEEVLIMMFCENTYTDKTVNYHILNANTIYEQSHSLPQTFDIGGNTMVYENKSWRRIT